MAYPQTQPSKFRPFCLNGEHTLKSVSYSSRVGNGTRECRLYSVVFGKRNWRVSPILLVLGKAGLGASLWSKQRKPFPFTNTNY